MVLRKATARWARVGWALLLGLPAAVSSQEKGAERLHAMVTLTSDYVYRGVSQSDGDPAIQGGFEFEADRGGFVGLWASSVQFSEATPRETPRDLELDLYAGWRFELGPEWNGEVSWTRLTYPGADTFFDYDYDEARLSLTWRGTLGATVGYQPEGLGSPTSAWVYEVLAGRPVRRGTELGAGYGYHDLEGFFGGGYGYWSAVVSHGRGRLRAALTYVGTSSAAERLWDRELVGDRWVVSVSAGVR